MRRQAAGGVSDLSASQARTLKMLGPLEGKRIPGGCDKCDAYQTVEPVAGGQWLLEVHHDDWCPVLARHNARREAS